LGSFDRLFELRLIFYLQNFELLFHLSHQSCETINLENYQTSRLDLGALPVKKSTFPFIWFLFSLVDGGKI
jgi:hypothetical protein